MNVIKFTLKIAVLGTALFALALGALVVSSKAEAADKWHGNKMHIGNSTGFSLYLTRAKKTAIAFNYAIELRGKNNGCAALASEKYIDMRWGGYLYRCKDIKGGLVITPATRSGKRMLANLAEHTRSGDYIEVSGITKKSIRTRL